MMNALTPLTLAGLGCGGRTRTYFSLAAGMPTRYRIAAAADPRPERLQMAREAARDPALPVFRSDRELLAQPKLADVLIIGTQDSDHAEHAVAAMERGYDLLLEKPIAPTEAEVRRVAEAAARLNRRVVVCHVLRYSPFYQKVKSILQSGRLGRILSINAVEGVGPWHQAHSFVRGHWSVVEKSSPMILAKSCHDLDILRWLVDRPCRRVSSFGELSYFRPEQAPPGAPERCTDGCPAATSCIYNAEHYLGKQRGWLRWVMDNEPKASQDEIRQWLRTSPWGRCVYRCDNSAVDHQTVHMEFADAIYATFTMTAFESGRHLEIQGTRARLRGGSFLRHRLQADIMIEDHESSNGERISVDESLGGYSGHGGGDPGLMLALYDEMRKPDPRQMHTSIQVSLESHLMAFAAEESRRTGQTVAMEAGA